MRKAALNKYMWGFIMIAPTVIGLIILNIYPFFQTIYLSFNVSQGLGGYEWVGTENYISLMKDGEVWRAVLNTLYYTFLSVPASIFLSLVIAVLINSDIRGTSAFRTIYFLPMVVAPAAVAMVWRWLFNKEMGIINFLLSFLGIDKIGWLTDPRFMILSVAIVGIWGSIGYNLIIFSAGLKGIPKTYYEAADIDGANPIKKFLHITMPLISPTLFFVLITSLMNALKQFDTIYVMLGMDNPLLEKGQTILYLFYKYAFIIREKGYASAIVMLAFMIIAIFTGVQFWYQKKWVHYE